jgi:hypothetical protein
MAVTIHDSPQDFTPSDNPINWTFSSDQTAQLNFSYLVEVYIGGVLTANELVFPTNGIYSRFDGSSYASVNCSAPTILNNFIEDSNNYNFISIKVIERFGDPILDGASATSSDVNFYKAKLYNQDFVDYDSNNYVINPGISKKWLTNFPGGYAGEIRPLVRRTDEQLRMMVINNQANVANLKIELFDSIGVSVASWMATPVISSNKITIINFTPSVIVSSTTITQTNFDDSAYMVVSSANYLDEFYIDLNDNCKFSTAKRIHFLSEIGSIESLSFDLLSRISGKVKSFGYEKTFGQWNGSSFDYTKEQGQAVDFAKHSERSMIVESDWLQEDVQHWLGRNLIESPLIWIEENDSLLRRKISSTSWKDAYHENEMLFKEQITLILPSKTSMIL